MANAFAYPLQKTLGVSDAGLAVLDDDELAAICAHELAHLQEPRGVVWSRMLRSWLIVIYAAMIAATVRPLPGSFGPVAYLWGFLGANLFLIVGVTLSSKLSLKMEHRADAQAAAAQALPGVYARALEKLYEVNLVPAVIGSKRRTHPDLYDRMLRAGVTPAYARPAPPPRWPALLGLATLVGVIFVGVWTCRLVAGELPDALLGHRESMLWKIGGGRAVPNETVELLDRPDFPR